MARRRPPDRLQQLLASAVSVFLERGYRRTQMADVARAMGVAPGTLYLYVESKEALFDLVVRRALVARGDEPEEQFPVVTPPPGATLDHLRERLAEEARLPALERALTRKRIAAADAELEAIIAELYSLIARRWQGIKLLERSALDWPELASIFFYEVRQALIDKLTRYLRRAGERGELRKLAHPQVTARLIVESIAWFAMHRHGDLRARDIDDDSARAAIVDLVTHGLEVRR